MQTLYDSAWHIPFSAWLPALAFLVVLARAPARAPRRGLFAALAVLIALDAWLNGALTPLASAPGSVRTAVGLAFVLVGDFRYFYVAERLAGGAHAFRRAALLTAVVPVLALPLRLLDVPERVLWLAYEGAFVVFAVVLRSRLWPTWLGAREASPEAARAVRALTTFELAQYGLWASADVLLLAHVEAGWLVRLVPNLLYYAAFVPFAWWCASEVRER